MRAHGLVLPILAALSSASVIAGAAALIRFDGTAGVVGRAPVEWPAEAGLPRVFRRPQIVVFAHPKCSCTLATLEELAKVQGAETSILFYRPDAESSWSEGPGWKQAAALPHTRVFWDNSGSEAKRFGSATSGTVLLYGAGGRLLFQGGITASRGHVGENRGLDKLALALRTGQAAALDPPVFGCGLFSSLQVAPL